MTSRRTALAATLAGFAVLAVLVATRLTVVTDVSFFFPADPAPEAAALSGGLTQGGSVMMIRLDGPDVKTVAEASDAVTETLRNAPLFAFVRNGRPHLPADLRDFFLQHHYRLGPPLTTATFETAGLRTAIEDGIGRLSTMQGWLFRDLFPHDPTGRLAALVGGMRGGPGPERRYGVWMTPAGEALVLARLTAAAGDLDAQAAAVAVLDDAVRPFAARGVSWAASGPGLFAHRASQKIQAEMKTLTAFAAGAVALVLLIAFRAPSLLLLIGLPVGAGVVAGALVTQLVFGQVHGVALTFGAVLAGVAIDYPIHLFVFHRRGEPWVGTARRLWRPMMIGAGTTIAGLLALSQSSFPGLAQIGTLTAVAMAVAVATNRWLLPRLAPEPDVRLRASLWPWLKRRPGLRRGMRWGLSATIVAAVGAALLAPGPLWESDISRLNVADPAAQRLDRALRRHLGRPDATRILLFEGRNAQAVLAGQWAVLPRLDQAVAEGRLGSYRAGASLLPPARVQADRLAELPEPENLRRRLVEATRGLPVKPDVFRPFVEHITDEKRALPLTLAALGESPAAPLFLAPWQTGGAWAGAIALTPPIDLSAADLDGARLVDLREIASTMVTDYREEALDWLVIGAGVGLLMLIVGLRQPRHVVRAAVPPALAVVATVSGLVAAGVPLNLFHILALLLVASIGVDYALFFPGYAVSDTEGRGGFLSVTLCSVTTVSVFLVLSLSSLQILSAIGVTVAIGSALSYVLTLCFSEA